MSTKGPQFTAGQLNTYPTPHGVSEVSRALRHTGRRVMLVPTMGALHDGHLALVRAAKRVPGAVVVVSIFVNPLQFGPREDLDAYPRTLDADLEMLGDEGVEIVFAPTPAAMYPDGPRTTVHPGSLGAELEGSSRPTHFAGMLTVVLKLLQIIRPDRAFFGEKDYQQLVLVRQMVDDLNVDIKIVAVPTVREADGLAMSSRRGARHRHRLPGIARPVAGAGAGRGSGPTPDRRPAGLHPPARQHRHRPAGGCADAAVWRSARDRLAELMFRLMTRRG